MIDLILIFSNGLENISLQVSTFANEPLKENFLGIDIH